MNKRRLRNLAIALALMSPFLTLYTIFFIYPLAQGIMYSLYRTTPTGDYYVGAGNYLQILTFKDPRLNYGFMNTPLYAAFHILALFLGLVFAWLLHTGKSIPKPSLIMTVILIPNMLSWVTLGFAWNVILSIITNLLRAQGYDLWHPFADPVLARWCVASIIMWAIIGFNTLLALSTLRSISQEYFEAAQIDGATGTQIFIHVTLPLIKPILIFQLITAVIASFSLFDPVATLTQGGPAWTSTSLMFYAGRQLQYAFNYGMACAIGLFVAAIVIALSFIQYRFIYKRLV